VLIVTDPEEFCQDTDLNKFYIYFLLEVICNLCSGTVVHEPKLSMNIDFYNTHFQNKKI
jgi:hypothetical protein